MFRLDGRVALVTGAASGIGAAIARVFAEAGADVVAGWYPPDPHDVEPTRTAVECGRAPLSRRRGRRLRHGFGRGDRRRARSRSSDGSTSSSRTPRSLATSPSPELDDERWNALLQVDLYGVFRCFRAAMPHMIEAGCGRLLATSSIAGAYQGWASHAHYATAKAGIVGLVRTLAVELGPYGITANAIAPGVIETPQSLDPVNSLGPDGVRDFAARVPVRRNGQPEDIAHTFLFLASEEASFLTGQVLLVDGGVSLSLT